MKILKNIFVLLLVSVIAFSCKSEKKDSAAPEDAVEEVAAEEEGTEAAPEVAAEADATEGEAEEETAEESAKDKLTVNYPRDPELAADTKEAIKVLYKENPTIQQHFYDAHSFAIFPKIGKGGLGVGGAGGKGLVFQDYGVIGGTSLAQATIGLQAGGQTYMEVIFFENQEALDRFKGGKTKFSGQASAVALKEGASVDIDYQDGVAVFTKAIGGLMAEASLGGQKFKYKDGVN